MASQAVRSGGQADNGGVYLAQGRATRVSLKSTASRCRTCALAITRFHGCHRLSPRTVSAIRMFGFAVAFIMNGRSTSGSDSGNMARSANGGMGIREAWRRRGARAWRDAGMLAYPSDGLWRLRAGRQRRRRRNERAHRPLAFICPTRLYHQKRT